MCDLMSTFHKLDSLLSEVKRLEPRPHWRETEFSFTRKIMEVEGLSVPHTIHGDILVLERMVQCLKDGRL